VRYNTRISKTEWPDRKLTLKVAVGKRAKGGENLGGDMPPNRKRSVATQRPKVRVQSTRAGKYGEGSGPGLRHWKDSRYGFLQPVMGGGGGGGGGGGVGGSTGSLVWGGGFEGFDETWGNSYCIGLRKSAPKENLSD